MDGPKRIQLTTIAPPEKPDKKGLPKMTVRFNLDLTESTDTACPEFFYPDLLKTQPSASAEKNAPSDDPFGDDDDPDKLAAIAKAFEEKYNKPVEGKKKKKQKRGYSEADYMYILGDGYDESDTFIDNSEAYDEVLPYEVTTKLGGFYINSGKLDFKELSEDSEEEFQPKMVKKNKKRRISSDEDSGAEEKVVKKKKIKDTLSVDGEVKKKKKKKLQPDGEKPFKKPKQPQDKDKQKQTKSASVAALIKSTSPNLNGEGQENGLSSSPADESSDSNDSNPHEKSSVSAAIDAVVSMAMKDDSNSQSDFVEEQKKEVDPENIPKLPPNLSADIEAKLEELKKQALVSRDGKTKFFTPSVNKLLLDVEMSSKGLTVSNRSAMYAHLAAYLPCSKDTLLKRARTLRVKELEDKIKEPLEKLRQVVNRMMPELQEKFEADCKKHAQEKAEEGQRAEVEKEGGKEETNTESDDEDKPGQPADATKKRVVGPRKKFPWDNNVRSLLNDVVRVKMHTLQMSKTRSQTSEEFCKAFLDQHVRPLWPKGWMQTRMLYKESKPAHGLWTNPQKTKKAMLVGKSPGVAVTSVTPAVKVSSATPSQPSINGARVVPVVNVTKLPTSTKTTPVFVSAAKSTTNNVNTPNLGPKRVTPTLLDYADSGSGSSASVKLVSPSTSVPQSSAMNLSIGSNSRGQVPTKQPVSATKVTEKWDHKVSDILRSSIPNPQPKSTTSPASGGTSNSFHSQFENFTANLISQGLASQKTKSPGQLFSGQAQALSQSLQRRPNQQLKVLQEQLALQQKHQMLLQQATGKTPTPPTVRPQANQNQSNSSKTGNQSRPPSQSPIAGNIPNQSPITSNQSRPPSQSPMSLAMAKSISSGQSGNKPVPKQLVSQFSKEVAAAQGMTMLTENVIRQQLSSSSSKNPSPRQPSPTVVVQTKTVNKPGPILVTTQSGQVSSTTDAHRRISPQSVNLPAHTISQVKPSVPQVVKAQTSQSASTQGLVFHKPGGNITITTGNKSAATFLKDLFTQAQSSVGKLPSSVDTSAQQQQALLQARALAAAKAGQKAGQQQWSPTSSKPSPQPRPVYQGSPDGHPKPFVVPTTGSRPVPGYQSVRLPNKPGEKVAAYPVPPGHRSAESGVYGNQMVTRPSPGTPTTSAHLTPEQHLYNALHYGYRGYQGSSALLQRAITSRLSQQLASPWVPPYIKQRGVTWRGKPPTWQREGTCCMFHFHSTHLTTPEGTGDLTRKIPKEVKAYYQSSLPFITCQTLKHGDTVPSVLEANSREITAQQEWEAEWNQAGLASRLSQQEYRARKRQRIQKRISDQLRQDRQRSEAALGSGGSHDLQQIMASISGRGTAAAKTKGSRFTHTEKLLFAKDEEKVASEVQQGPAVQTEEELQQQRETEVSGLREELAGLTSQLDRLDLEVKKFTASMQQMGEEIARQAHANEDKEDGYKVKKRTLDLLPDAENNIAKLQSVVDSSAQRLISLSNQWEKHRSPLIDQYRTLKDLSSKTESEAQKKLEEIKEFRRRMKEVADEAKNREELQKQLQSEYERMTKDVNRSAYTKRIMEIVSNIKKQKKEIDKVLVDTRTVQKEINQLSGKLDRQFTVTDELIFRDAKKDEAVKKAYRYLASLHESCELLIQTVEETGGIMREIRELEDQIETEGSKKVLANLEKITADYQQMKKENDHLVKKIKGKS